MEFRPCPSFPGFSASLSGVVRRDARKSGKPLAVRMERVVMGGVSAYLDRVVHDAWGDLAPVPREYRPRPNYRCGKTKLVGRSMVPLDDGTILRSSYRDGRIMTVEEWRAAMLVKTLEAQG